jgi:hypothetical protein
MINEFLQWLVIAILAILVVLPIYIDFKKAGQDEDD